MELSTPISHDAMKIAGPIPMDIDEEDQYMPPVDNASNSKYSPDTSPLSESQDTDADHEVPSPNHLATTSTTTTPTKRSWDAIDGVRRSIRQKTTTISIRLEIPSQRITKKSIPSSSYGSAENPVDLTPHGIAGAIVQVIDLTEDHVCNLSFPWDFIF